MVKRTGAKRNRIYTASGVLLGMGMAALPACAQQSRGMLEQMQNEVAEIARTSRSAIVTIEDSRALAVDYSNSPLRKTDLADQIAHVLIDKKAADEEVTRRQQMFNAGTLTLLELQKAQREQSRLDARLAYLRERLTNAGQEDALTQQRQETRERIAELEIDLKFLAAQAQILQQQVNAGIAAKPDLEEAQRQMAHVEVDLNTARQQLSALTAQSEAARRNQEAMRMGQAYRQAVLSGGVFVRPVTPKSGSGFSIGDGYIVTTADVVQGMTNPVVVTDDGRQIRAALVAVDKELNIGLLRLASAAPLAALKLGDSASVAPGHFAISIGNQTGQINSVALSMISGLRTQGLTSSAHYYPDLLQIDGTIGAGTSGAPVLNARGEVIGMVAAVPTDGGGAALIANPTLNSSQGTLWVTPQASTSPYKSLHLGPAPKIQQNVPPLRYQPTGPVLQMPKRSGPTPQNGAAQAAPQIPGKSADSLSPPKAAPRVRADDKPFAPELQIRPQTQTGASLYKLVQPNNNLSGPMSFPALPTSFSPSATAGESAPRAEASAANTGFAIPVNELKGVLDQLKSGKNVAHAWLGLDLEDVDNAHAENGIVRLDKQVRIRNLYTNSPAAKAGVLQPGDVLVSLDGIPVHTGNEVRSAVLLRFTPGQKVKVAVQRSGGLLTFTMTLEARPADTPALLPAAPPAKLNVHF